jgi:hypothetical protein
MTTHATDNQARHQGCGGTILDGGAGDQWHRYCDRCHAMLMSMDDIVALRTEAGEAGDMAAVATCDRAIDGDLRARADCIEIIEDARADA